MNATTTDDDEWETADLNVGKMTLVGLPPVYSVVPLQRLSS